MQFNIVSDIPLYYSPSFANEVERVITKNTDVGTSQIVQEIGIFISKLNQGIYNLVHQETCVYGDGYTYTIDEIGMDVIFSNNVQSALESYKESLRKSRIFIRKQNMENKKLFLNEDGSINFTNFNLLNESEQVAAMSTWNQEQIMSYYMQNSISEEECFTPVLELINDLEKIERNGSKVFIENGEEKTILNEDIQKTGYMSVEEMGNILHAYVNDLEKRYKR